MANLAIISKSIILGIILTTRALKFEPKTINGGMVFTEISKAKITFNDFKICYFVNLTDFFELSNKLNIITKDIISECSNVSSLACNISSLHLNHFNETLENNVKIIKSFDKITRRKRSFRYSLGRTTVGRMGGSLLNWLFGVMDAETAECYDDKINELQNVSIKAFESRQNQTIIIEKLIKLNNFTTNQFQLKIKNVSDNVIDLHSFYGSVFRDLNNKININSLTTLALMAVLEHNELADQIINTLQDAVNGKISHLIPTSDLLANLDQIKLSLKDNQMLPIELHGEDALHIYKYTKSRTTLYKGKILLELTVPILERDTFKLYLTTPIPIRKHNTTFAIIPQNNHFLLNTEKIEFIPITETELNFNSVHVGNELISQPESPSFHNKDEICELNALYQSNISKIEKNCQIKQIPNANYVIAVDINVYFISVQNHITLWQKCWNKPATSQLISESGFLHLEVGCTVKTDQFKIHAHGTQTLQTAKMVYPLHDLQLLLPETIDFFTANFTHEIKNTIMIDNKFDNFNELAEATIKLRENAALEKKLKNIHYDMLETKESSWQLPAMFGGIPIATTLIFLGIIGFCSYKIISKRFDLISTILVTLLPKALPDTVPTTTK